MTRNAAREVRTIASWTERQWGKAQAYSYIESLEAGFKTLGASTGRVRSRRDDLSGLDIFRIRHHYAVYQVLDEDRVAILALLHERMDVPAHLEDIKRRSKAELDALRQP
nr:type II toxin-antitoxin system RelE/ParE family toxin [Asticcacaulis aquaticus]